MKKSNRGFIIGAILSGIAGAVLCFYGNKMNRDLERQLKSYWNTGKNDNTGDILFYTGIICFILCVVFAAVAVAIAAINYSHSLNGDNSSVPHNQRTLIRKKDNSKVFAILAIICEFILIAFFTIFGSIYYSHLVICFPIAIISFVLFIFSILKNHRILLCVSVFFRLIAPSLSTAIYSMIRYHVKHVGNYSWSEMFSWITNYFLIIEYLIIIALILLLSNKKKFITKLWFLPAIAYFLEIIIWCVIFALDYRNNYGYYVDILYIIDNVLYSLFSFDSIDIIQILELLFIGLMYRAKAKEVVQTAASSSPAQLSNDDFPKAEAQNNYNNSNVNNDPSVQSPNTDKVNVYQATPNTDVP